MALTISTHPSEVITNAPEFTVTTSLTEGASYQNLRIRATIYIGGESDPVAVLEQPKGLDDWDFFELLKSLTGKCNETVGGSDYHIGPTIGSELLTAWTNYLGQFETFTVSGRTITSAIDTNASGGLAVTNDLGSGDVGEIYILGCESTYNDSGAADFYLKLAKNGLSVEHSACKYAGFSSNKLIANHIYFGMIHASETAPIWLLGSDAGSNGNVAGIFTVRKISDFKNNPGVYFHVKFEEVYENASDVTTIGDEEWADTLLFIPAIVKPGEDFATDFLASGATGFELSRTEESDSLYKFGIGMEKRMMYVTTSPYIRCSVVIDSGTVTQNDVSNAGWGMVIINETALSIDAEDETIGILLYSIVNSGSIIYTIFSLNVNTELRCFPDIKVLSYVGDLGEETMLFRGLRTKTGAAEKTYYQNVNRIRKVLKAYKKFVQILRTLYETQGSRELLHELIYTEKPVWMFNPDQTDNYTEVTVINDETPIIEKDKLIESEIEIEYYE